MLNRPVRKGAIVAWAGVAVLAVSAFAGCKSSSSSGGKDATADGTNPDVVRPDVAKDVPGTGMCTGDDGTRNKDNGLACACGIQCKSGSCVDGVCCNSACDGTCVSCALPTALGMCTPIPAGVKPRAALDCQAQDATTCGRDGTCDGAGSCRNFPTGTVCQPGTCDGDALVGTYQCDGGGRCKLGASTVCAPFSCDPTAKACFDKCVSDGDCVSGRRCVNGSCGPKMTGATCSADGDCASGHCADGLCCNGACSGPCRSCNQVGLEGICSPTPKGQGHPLCMPHDASTCDTTGVCDGFGTCTKYPANTVCGAATCSGNTLETAQTCDGLGTCQPPQAHACGAFRCNGGACASACTVATAATDCADGIACVNESCGPKVDGQACTSDSACESGHCVDGVCCDTACTGACRSCALPNSIGQCTLLADGAVDARNVCEDTGASSCGTDGMCDATGGCRKYPTGTVCAGEACASDVYTGPSTCNASGQCVKPGAMPCNPYHCNLNKCFSSCTIDAQCIAPNTCGQNGNISSCGPKPIGADCSAGNQCQSTFCAQGKCCDSACTGACKACNIAGSIGTCSDVQSGADPQTKCAAQDASTCGTTGVCAAGQCAKFSSSAVCKTASCTNGGPPSPALTPVSKCDGNGACVTPSNMSCAPGRCDGTALMCVNTCTTNADCTAPNTCVGGSCGLIPKGSTCTTTATCMAGLTCNHDKVCCDQTCDGVCETCKPPSGSAGTCTAVAAGQPDPSMMCVATASTSCGLNGKCGGNNSVAGTARCQDYDGMTGCRNLACTNGVVTHAATCTGGGACGPLKTDDCAPYKCLNSTQCANTCSSDSDCVGMPCNTFTKLCGNKQAQGAMCNVTADCAAGTCADGVCCNTACNGPCQACNLGGGNTGVCTSVTAGTSDAMCPADATPTGCGNTGLCASGGACAQKAGNTCRAASCADGFSSIAATTCNGTGSCPSAPTAVSCGPASCSSITLMMTTAGTCSGAGVCAAGTTSSCGTFTCNGTICNTSCTLDSECANGAGCNTTTHQCAGWINGHVCPAAGGSCGTGNCVDGVCCDTACTGLCKSCGTGTCTNISGMSASDCPANGACGNTGACSGGACVQASPSVTCGAPESCVDGTAPADSMHTPVSHCSGGGACTQEGAVACPGHLLCNGNVCYGSCTMVASAECVTGFMCAMDGDLSCQ